MVEFIQPCLVRFIYLTSANRVHSLCLSEIADSFIYIGSGGFRAKKQTFTQLCPFGEESQGNEKRIKRENE